MLFHIVSRHEHILRYIWPVPHKPHRGKGKPSQRSRFGMAGNQDWHTRSTVTTRPVLPECAICAVSAASFVSNFSVHTEDLLRTYLQSNTIAMPVYI